MKRIINLFADQSNFNSINVDKRHRSLHAIFSKFCTPDSQMSILQTGTEQVSGVLELVAQFHHFKIKRRRRIAGL